MPVCRGRPAVNPGDTALMFLACLGLRENGGYLDPWVLKVRLWLYWGIHVLSCSVIRQCLDVPSYVVFQTLGIHVSCRWILLPFSILHVGALAKQRLQSILASTYQKGRGPLGEESSFPGSSSGCVTLDKPDSSWPLLPI